MLSALQLDPEEMMFGSSLACCAVYLLIFIIWVYVCIWVYRDAEKRGSNGMLWAILVFLFGIIPLIIWLIVRPPVKQQSYGYAPPPPTPTYHQCPSCGQPMTFVQQYNRWYCNYCRKYP